MLPLIEFQCCDIRFKYGQIEVIVCFWDEEMMETEVEKVNNYRDLK